MLLPAQTVIGGLASTIIVITDIVGKANTRYTLNARSRIIDRTAVVTWIICIIYRRRLIGCVHSFRRSNVDATFN